MDGEQPELQFIGFFGTIAQSFKLIVSRPKIFTDISLTVIQPLSFLYLSEYIISDLIFPNTTVDETDLRGFSFGTHRRTVGFWIFKVLYVTVLLLHSLIATSAVVFTVASLFAARQISSAAALRAIPKACGRLAVTFILGFVAAGVYIVIGAAVIALSVTLIGTSAGGIVVLVVLGVLYLAGILYLAAVWNLASVVSVLEPTYGLSAVKRGFELIKGKILVSGGLVLVFGVLFLGVDFLFVSIVVAGVGGGLGVQIPEGNFSWILLTAVILIGLVAGTVIYLSCVLLTAVILIGLVTGTVIYFVCKSYHHENIDMSLLSDHLQGYLGNYVVIDKSYADNHNNNNVQLSQNV